MQYFRAIEKKIFSTVCINLKKKFYWQTLKTKSSESDQKQTQKTPYDYNSKWSIYFSIWSLHKSTVKYFRPSKCFLAANRCSMQQNTIYIFMC